MCRKLIVVIFSILILSLVLRNTARADLVAHWRLDETSGTIAHDASGNGHDGTIMGEPKWGAGKIGGALEFDGTGDVVELGAFDVVGPGITMAAWLKPNGFGINDGRILTKANEWGENDHWWMFSTIAEAGEIRLRFRLKTTDGQNTTTLIASSGVLEIGEWQHAAATWDGTTMRLYLNGEEVGSTAKGGDAVATDASVNASIGSQPSEAYDTDISHISKYFHGFLDDVRLYDGALTQDEIQILMEASGGYPFAFGPTPADGAVYPDTWVNIGWSPGDFAVSHDIYLGDNFDDVNAGAESTFQSNQADTFIVVGFPGFPFPDGLVPGTTYYWRIDEVNDTEPNSPWVGPVWSFSIPPKTAYAPDPANGAESVDLNVQLGWTAGFGAKMHYVYFGDNFDDVSNATEGLPLGAASFDPGPLELSKTYYWRVDEFDIVETHKGDVWSFTTVGAVGSLEPANGAVDVTQTPTLSWVPGVFAASHQVYFGADKEAVKNADTSSPEYKGTRNLGSESYDAGQLEWNTTYYWRIDEVNNTNADSPWIGPVWSFTTANFLVVDDFESYNDLDPSDPASNRIFNVWLDGFDNPAINGSVVGYDNPPFTEQTIVHGGLQSMPMSYDNAVGKSEATLTLTSTRDWTVNGINTLTIWFRGEAANAAENLYVALNGSAVVNHDNPDAALRTSWTQWNIDLQAFVDQGVNLANVSSITLGLGNRSNPVAGGSGMMYFDDIRLYALAP
ncbi:MAG: LamG domain-containing protein [Planctomycetes bacterium]|nr:LamG domain-containing protein [Planctomycetota bacterium]